MIRWTILRSPSLTITSSRCALALLSVLTAPPARGAPPPPSSAAEAAEAAEAPPPHTRAPVQTEPASAAHQHAAAADPKAGTSVSLEGLLAYADRNSPVLTVARSTRSRAEAARAAASVPVAANPTLSVAVGPRVGAAGTGVDIEASLLQQLQIAGQRGARKQAAQRLRELTDAEIEQLRWAVHCDVHAAFHRTLVEQERARLAERVVAFQAEVLRVVERQIAAGETAPLTLRLAQAEVAQAEQLAVLARQGLLVARIRLAQLAGWPASTPPLPSGGVDLPRDPPPLTELQAAARTHLPTLRTLSARAREADGRLRVARREAWPRPSVGVQYRHEGNPTAEGPYDVVLGAVSLQIPVFQLNQGERALASADRAVADAELRATNQLLEGRIAEARSEVVAAAARTRAYGSEILPRFEENLTLLRRSFELGEIDLLALSTGRERFLRIQSDALGAQQDYFVALSGLERVVGVDLFHDDHHEELAP